MTNNIPTLRSVAMLGLFLCSMAALPRQALAGAYDDFFKAVQLDDARTINALIQRGLDPNIIEGKRGDTGLILGLREDSKKVIAALIQARDINFEVRARNGDTALMIAAYKGNRNAVLALLEKGAEPNQTGWTALHYAAAVGNNDIVKIMLDRSAYIDAESPNKTTPIMMAARAGHILTVKLLLDEGADATLKNDQGMTAIDLAVKYEHPDIAEGLTYQLRKAGKF